ncbi:MAG TPA: serine hydrolase domain-containing protein [Actinomycetota bacterium]|nr:serine hydrolase domain-containing protein [Actinomycetota bacterium]
MSEISTDALRGWVAEAAERHQVPGVAVGIYQAGAEGYAFHGVTSVENPLPVDEHTLFQFGSTGKTFTATAVMRLVEQGLVDLDAPVRTYVPELRLRDEQVARDVTVLHLLNHTAGWAGDLMTGTGDGDDALERYVALMADIEQVTPLGSTVSYNNASLSLAGRVIEKVTGTTFEQAIRDLLLEPLALTSSYFFPNEIMTRRFVVGHRNEPDGSIRVARPWALPRGGNPAGGISANAADQIAWARFHLGDGRAPDGTRILTEESLKRMQTPTADMRGSALGDHVGISWLIRDVDGVRTVGHGGTMNGQLSAFLMVPERDFAIISMTNSAPNGSVFNDEVVRWALETALGVKQREPEPVQLADADLQQYAGTYETIAVTAELVADRGGLLLKVEIKPETAAQLREAGEEVPEQPPFRLGLLPDGDRYVVTDGPAKGMQGYFARDGSGRVTGVHVGGRMATRVAEPAST